MAVRLSVTSNAREVSRAIGDFARSALPKAQAIAATKAAYDTRDALRASMSATFTLRSRGLPKAIVAVPAEKSDWPRVHAIVGIRNDAAFPAGFLVQHITGEDKVPKRSAKSILVPTSNVRRTAGGRIPKAAQPRELISAKQAFTTPTQFWRRGRGKRGKAKVLFTRVARARIAARWDFLGIAQARFAESYPAHFEREYSAALQRAAQRSAATSSVR
jgi:hypothetical protein